MQFGWTIVDTTFLGWTAAEISARLLVGLELVLGIFFLASLILKRFTIPTSIALLTIFSVYLIRVWYLQGNSANCGCFGEVIPMSPSESLLKNGFLLLLIIWLYRVAKHWNFKYEKWVLSLLAIASFSFPFIFNIPECFYLKEKDVILNEPIPLSYLYTSTTNAAPTQELRKGKHIVAFLSATCVYCRFAAKRLTIMKRRRPDLPFYAIINGESIGVKEFFEDTKMNNVPYTVFNGVGEFMQMNRGGALPTIKWIRDTTLIKETNYASLQENDIDAWLVED